MFFLFLAIILICNGCKKYDDDDRRYFKTPCGRIAKKWQLYKITDKKGRDFTDSLIYFKIPDNNWALIPEQSFTYSGLILELERSNNKLCIETDIIGSATVLNKPFSSGYYALRVRRTILILDLRPHEHTPTRYFINDYTINKMTSDELVFGNGLVKAYFKVAG